MKSFFIIALLCFAAVQGLQVAQQQAINIRNSCISESGADRNRVEVLRQGIFQDDDDKLKEYVLCALKKLGLQNESGQIDGEKVKALLGGPSQEIDDLITRCIRDKGSPQETAYQSLKCIYQDAKYRSKY